MRKGRHSALFLLLVAAVGLCTGAAISVVLPSLSPDVAFFVIVGVSVALVIVTSSVRAASEEKPDERYDVRDVAAFGPLSRLVQTEEATVAAKLEAAAEPAPSPPEPSLPPPPPSDSESESDSD